MLNVLALSAWRHGVRRLHLIGCYALVLLLATSSSAEEGGAPEYRIKAAMIFKFLSYTQWPDSAFETATSPYRIWVLGSSPISEELDTIIRGRMVNARPVRQYVATTADDVTQAHVVFVGRDAERYLPDMARLTRREPVLVVTEGESGLEGGSTINFRLHDGRIGFDVSLDNAGDAAPRLSSRLLSVALSVERETQ